MTLFNSQGYLVQLPSNAQMLSCILTDRYSAAGIFNFSDRLAMVTSYSVKESSAVQLRMMFENKSYINVFGDQFGLMSLSGIFAAGDCSNDKNYTGFEAVATYFREHRASRYAPPLIIMLGGIFNPMFYEAFLLECSIGTADPQLQIGNFSMQLAYAIPDEEDNPLTGYYDFIFDDTIGDFPNPPGGSPGDVIDSPGLA